MPQYLWEAQNWPDFNWKSELIIQRLASARKRQGRFLQEMESLGFEDGLRACAIAVEEDVIQTAAIEGEKLDREGVRSSVALRLGLPAAGLRPADKDVDGLVDVLLDATHNHAQPLTKERLCGWHSALFTSGRSSFLDIITGAWRNTPMQVISGPYGRRRVHFVAPPPERIESEMDVFFSWWDDSRKKADGIIRAALAHLYFVTIHPFDDGNGRLARTITDMALAQDEGLRRRYYSLSARIMQERNAYYDSLEKTQCGDGDCTEWLLWFIKCFDHALETAEAALRAILLKAAFWKRHAETNVNERQRKALNRLLDVGKDGFEGGLSTRKYAGMTRVSRATAWRKIEDMLQKNMIVPLPGGGRSQTYEIKWESECPLSKR